VQVILRFVASRRRRHFQGDEARPSVRWAHHRRAQVAGLPWLSMWRAPPRLGASMATPCCARGQRLAGLSLQVEGAHLSGREGEQLLALHLGDFNSQTPLQQGGRLVAWPRLPTRGMDSARRGTTWFRMAPRCAGSPRVASSPTPTSTRWSRTCELRDRITQSKPMHSGARAATVARGIRAWISEVISRPCHPTSRSLP